MTVFHTSWVQNQDDSTTFSRKCLEFNSTSLANPKLGYWKTFFNPKMLIINLSCAFSAHFPYAKLFFSNNILALHRLGCIKGVSLLLTI